jgi:hypothetical protein
MTLYSVTTDIVTQFLQHGRYLRNWSNRTIETYQQSLVTGSVPRQVGIG